MARTVMIFNNPIFKLATTQAGLTAGTAYQCQLTRAEVVASPNFNTIPATGCVPATQSPGLSSWELQIDWLEDWSASLGGLSAFAYTNDGKPMWYELTADAATPTTKATGQCYVTSGSFGGTFGDGSAADTTGTWPCVDKPVITFPSTLAATEAEEAEDAVA